jgi:hypothetical protein
VPTVSRDAEALVRSRSIGRIVTLSSSGCLPSSTTSAVINLVMEAIGMTFWACLEYRMEASVSSITSTELDLVSGLPVGRGCDQQRVAIREAGTTSSQLRGRSVMRIAFLFQVSLLKR